jgi:hypothetical protein
MPQSSSGKARPRAKERFVIQASDGRFATYDLGHGGPSLTKILALAYTWDSREDAQKQLPLYRAALAVPLAVTRISPA